MNEFITRIAAQRQVLEAVNSVAWIEPLLGLSAGALARWCAANGLARDAVLVGHLHAISDKLAFLANRSQQQISEEYAAASAEVAELTGQLPTLLRQHGAGQRVEPKG